jgi:hypothetical protein
LRGDQQDEMLGRDPRGARLNSQELGSLPNTSRSVETCPVARRSGRPRRRRTVQRRLLLVDAHGEALPALAAAVQENLLPTLRRHAGAKSVSPHTAKVMRLVRSLHEGYFRFRGRVVSVSAAEGEDSNIEIHPSQGSHLEMRETREFTGRSRDRELGLFLVLCVPTPRVSPCAAVPCSFSSGTLRDVREAV